MQEDMFELNAELRSGVGKGASRRLRHEKKVPAILYGGDKDPVSLTLKHNELEQHLEHEAFYSHILTVKYNGTSEKAILRDMQRHPSKPWVLHVDLQRVSAKQAIRMNVPLHFLNEETAVGVKDQGGVMSHVMTEVEVSCLPKDLPEYLEVDVAALEMGSSLHVSDLKLPKGVTLAVGLDEDQPIATIFAPRSVTAAEEEEAEAAEAAGEAGVEGGEAEEAPE